MTIAIMFVVIGVLAGLCLPRHPYPTNVLWGFDVTVASVTGSPKKQTISDYIGDKVRAGRRWALLLDRLFQGHFAATDEDRTRRDFYASSFGILVGAGVVGLWLWARWTYPEFVVRNVETPYFGFLLAWLLAQQVTKR